MNLKVEDNTVTIFGTLFIMLLTVLLTLLSQPLSNANATIIQDVFNKDRFLDSTGKEYADDKYWWVSKGEMKIKNDQGFVDEDHFRAMIRHDFNKNDDYMVQVYFKYNDYFGSDPTDSVGFYFNHRDEANKYSVGIRADGYSEIKEKNDGQYNDNQNTKRIFKDNGDGSNKIPDNTWIGLRIFVDQKSDSNNVRLFVDKGDGIWKFVTKWTDKGDLIEGGEVGLRIDGYDVSLKDFQVLEF